MRPIGAVHDHADPLRGDAALDRELAQRLVHGDQLIGEGRRCPGGDGDERQQRTQQRVRESVAEEFGHVLVEVEQEWHAGQLLRERGEVEEVGHRRHLDQVVAAGGDARRARRQADRAVNATYSAMWPAKPTEATVDRQAHDPQGAVALLGAPRPGGAGR